MYQQLKITPHQKHRCQKDDSYFLSPEYIQYISLHQNLKRHMYITCCQRVIQFPLIFSLWSQEGSRRWKGVPHQRIQHKGRRLLQWKIIHICMYSPRLERVLDFDFSFWSVMRNCGLTWKQTIATSLLYSYCSSSVGIIQFTFLSSNHVMSNSRRMINWVQL